MLQDHVKQLSWIDASIMLKGYEHIPFAGSIYHSNLVRRQPTPVFHHARPGRARKEPYQLPFYVFREHTSSSGGGPARRSPVKNSLPALKLLARSGGCACASRGRRHERAARTASCSWHLIRASKALSADFSVRRVSTRGETRSPTCGCGSDLAAHPGTPTKRWH